MLSFQTLGFWVMGSFWYKNLSLESLTESDDYTRYLCVIRSTGEIWFIWYEAIQGLVCRL